MEGLQNFGLVWLVVPLDDTCVFPIEPLHLFLGFRIQPSHSSVDKFLVGIVIELAPIVNCGTDRWVFMHGCCFL